MEPAGAAPTALFHLYRGLTSVAAPLAYWIVSRKLQRHGVPAARQHERLGNASLPRPPGRLVWFHAASVGESLSVLTLITRMGERLPDASFLITSGTATSAELIARRMPPRTCHQFAPLDAQGPVRRFYDHWRPDAGIIVESELWPLMLSRAHDRGMPLALLNARLSAKSVQGWCKVPATSAFILDQFNLMLTQNRLAADNLLAMGADPARVRVGTNLKATSAPLPVDTVTLGTVRDQLNGRPAWVASSTHPGEEEIVLAAHARLLRDHPALCLVLVPRHPDRGDSVADLVRARGLTLARRTAGEKITPDIQVYLADTLGETGTWYALTPLVFLGGSLLTIGGHNPFEPAQAGAAVLTGPHVANFAETFTPLIASGGAQEVTDGETLAAAVDLWLTDPNALQAARAAARAYVDRQQSALDAVIDQICDTLGLSDHA
ncbi:3-deoxy-D-manno-octulosonic acid transferase [Sedimentitalea sp. JM2-8]|uniref:3-deoxy-D-manno-octulosonic acid transferase n=1 Tax=Sedimentitalea xiamensis TaxID=3050037 RepID=A0ABT7FBZ3_9RHOB|nr:3-deoxy-D-manno-octulosonic acid transferase [Sedimentitalea xiamensis]MDK3072359.1 3-deoxy-D-manno-octulosonic acid transferase [Sedimentitalea xiamensis]